MVEFWFGVLTLPEFLPWLHSYFQNTAKEILYRKAKYKGFDPKYQGRIQGSWFRLDKHIL